MEKWLVKASSVDSDNAVARGIAMKILSVFVFTLMSMCIKIASQEVPPGEAVFFRSAFAIPVILVWLFVQGEFPAGIRTANPMGHFWRALAGSMSMAMHFAALGLLAFSDVIAIGYAAPLIATILAAMFLGERIRIFRMSAVAIGLVGVLLILYPNLSLTQGETSAIQALGAMFALTGAVFAAIAQVFVRKMVLVENTSAIVFWFSVAATALSLITLPFGWVMPSPWFMTVLITAGLLGGIGQILLTRSYRYAETGVIAPFDYTSMLFALTAGFFLFDEVPSMMMLGGAALIIVSGIIILYRERRLGIQRARARKVITPQG